MNALKLSTVLSLLTFTEIGQADPLDTWTSRNPLPTGNTLYGVAYGGGQFVAVGLFGTIVTSTDGVNWVQRERGTNIAFANVAYGSGKFVALGNDWTNQWMSTVVTSVDGTNWAPSAPVWYDFRCAGLAHGGSRFVATGWDTGPTTLLTSPDGLEWDWGLGGNESLYGICYGKGQFVAVGISWPSGSPAILTSLDGTSWMERTMSGANGPTAGVNNIAYGNGRFVVVGDAVLASTDAINWVQGQSPTTNTLVGIAYGNGRFVAVGESGAMVTSADGENWVRRTSGTANGLRAIAYGNGHFVAVGDGGTILESGPVINLTLTPSAGTGPLKLSLEGPTGLDYTIQTSTDLTSWRNLTNITTLQPSTIIFDALPDAGERVFYRTFSQ